MILGQKKSLLKRAGFLEDWQPFPSAGWRTVSSALLLFHYQVILGQKKSLLKRAGFLEDWQRPTFPHGIAVSSALVGLTSLFGMGRGEHHRKNHQKIFNIF